MVCRPCQVTGTQLEAAYRRQMEGGGGFLPVAVEGTGTVQGVWGGDGGWIDESTHEDTTWASGRRDMELDNLSHRGITADVSHGLPGQGRPADLHG